MVNPPLPRQLTFKAALSVGNYTYGTTNSDDVVLLSNKVKEMDEATLTAIPLESGATAIYILQIKGQYVSDTLEVEFPEGFSLKGELTASAYWSNGTEIYKMSYFDVLQKSYASLVKLSFTRSLGLHQAIDLANITTPSGYWLFVLFRFVYNPSYYDPSQSFLLGSLNQHRQLLYTYRGRANLQVNLPAQALHFSGLGVGDSDLIMLTTHNLTYKVDQLLYTNLTSFVIFPPSNSPLYALKQLDCCFHHNNILIECHQCTVGRR